MLVEKMRPASLESACNEHFEFLFMNSANEILYILENCKWAENHLKGALGRSSLLYATELPYTHNQLPAYMYGPLFCGFHSSALGNPVKDDLFLVTAKLAK